MQSEPALQQRPVTLIGLVSAVGFVAAVATLLGFLGPYHWLFDLFAHFRGQYVIALAGVVAILIACHARNVALLFGVALAANLVCLAPYYLPHGKHPGTIKQTMRAVYFNVNTANTRYADTIAFLQRIDADLVLVEEVDESWLAALKVLESRYAYSVAEPRADNFGIALFSRWPITEEEIVEMGDAGVPAITAVIDTPQGKLLALGIHTLPPVSLAYVTDRDRQLAAIPEYLGGSERPTLVLGDLNTTPWSVHFRRLLANSGLEDCGRGFGLQPTWPTSNRALLIPIDHCLKSQHIGIAEKFTAPDLGSDHLPSVVDFSFQGQGDG